MGPVFTDRMEPYMEPKQQALVACMAASEPASGEPEPPVMQGFLNELDGFGRPRERQSGQTLDPTILADILPAAPISLLTAASWDNAHGQWGCRLGDPRAAMSDQTIAGSPYVLSPPGVPPSQRYFGEGKYSRIGPIEGSLFAGGEENGQFNEVYCAVWKRFYVKTGSAAGPFSFELGSVDRTITVEGEAVNPTACADGLSADIRALVSVTGARPGVGFTPVLTVREANGSVQTAPPGSGCQDWSLTYLAPPKTGAFRHVRAVPASGKTYSFSRQANTMYTITYTMACRVKSLWEWNCIFCRWRDQPTLFI